MEFKKFFFRLFVKNTGKNNSDFSTLQEDSQDIIDENGIELQPNSTYDSLTIDTANKWIGIKKHKTNNIVDGVSFFHSQSGAGEIIAINDITSEKDGVDSDMFASNDEITLTTLTFDEAGHITGQTYKKYKIPNLDNVILTEIELNKLLDLLNE